jgi:hypothetical protein
LFPHQREVRQSQTKRWEQGWCLGHDIPRTEKGHFAAGSGHVHDIFRDLLCPDQDIFTTPEEGECPVIRTKIFGSFLGFSRRGFLKYFGRSIFQENKIV